MEEILKEIPKRSLPENHKEIPKKFLNDISKEIREERKENFKGNSKKKSVEN